MKYSIDLVSPSAIDQIKKLAFICEIDEQIDEQCDFLCAFDKELGLVGVAGVNRKRELYPQFEHIIIHPKRQRTRISVMLMQRVESYLQELGYKEYVCYIKSEKKVMSDYAIKFGFKKYSEMPRGTWYYKSLLKEEVK